MAERELVVKIIGDEKDLLRALRTSGDATKRFGISAGTALKGALIFEGVRRGLDALGGAVRSGISEFTEMQKVTAQTQAALASTGGVANVTAGQVERLAGRLSSLSGVDDELIQSGENLLLTFKNVRNELGQGNRIFDRATAAALDLSVAGFGSIESTAKQLGKALNDPVKGMASLGRAGVTFTQGQRDTIKRLVETNRVLDAQKLILREVESQVGGSAKAYGETLPGSLAKIREAFRNAFGNLVAVVADPLSRALAAFADFVPQIERGVARVSDAVGPALGSLVDAFMDRLPELQRIGGSLLEPLRQHVLPVAREVVQIVGNMWAGVVAVFADNEEALRRIAGNLGELLANVWAVARPTIVFLFEKALPAAIQVAIPVLEALTGIVRVLSQVFVRVVSTIVKSLDVFLGALTKVTDAASHLPFVGDQFAGVSDKINATRDSLRGFVGELDALDGRQVRVSVEVDVTTGRREEGAAGHDTTATKPVEQQTRRAAERVKAEGAAAGTVTREAAKATTATTAATTAVDKQRQAFDRLMGRLGIRRDAAEETRRINDDLKVLRATENALLEQIKVEGRTNELVAQLQDIRQERARLLGEQRERRQFRALGLTATGDEPVPGVRALRRQLNQLDQAVEGTFLDTRKTESLMARIRKVLSGGLGKVGDDVRATIRRILDDLDNQLGSSATRSSASRRSPINANRILAGLGLDPDEMRQARQRLNQLGATAVIPRAAGPGGAFGLAGAGFAGGATIGPGAPVIVNVYGDIVTPDSDKFLKDMQKKAKRNSGTRSGVRAGGIGGV